MVLIPNCSLSEVAHAFRKLRQMTRIS